MFVCLLADNFPLFNSEFLLCHIFSFNTLLHNLIQFCRWVEFAKKRVANRVASTLNGEQIGTYISIFVGVNLDFLDSS